MIKINESRNFGLDIIRAISMAMIVLLHILGHGGLLDSLETGSTSYYVFWLLETVSYVGVNIYALITGYFGYTRKYCFTDIIIMWLRVLTCDVFSRALIKLLFWDDISLSKVLKGFFPILTTEYWYFSAYFFLFLFMPILNIAINNISKVQFRVALISIFSAASLLSSVNDSDIFRLHSGLSALWLIIIYLLGAYIGKYGVSLPKYKAFILFFVSIVVTYLYKIFNQLENTDLNDMALHRYVSPTIILGAVGLFMLFKDYNVRHNSTKKVLTVISPLIFSIYLLHENTLIRQYLITDKFVNLASRNTLIILFYVFLSLSAIYILGLIIDYFREVVFRKLKIKQRIFYIESLIRERYGIYI